LRENFVSKVKRLSQQDQKSRPRSVLLNDFRPGFVANDDIGIFFALPYGHRARINQKKQSIADNFPEFGVDTGFTAVNNAIGAVTTILWGKSLRIRDEKRSVLL